MLYTISPVPEMYYLWRAWVDGGRAPERVELAGLGAQMPALSAEGHRLAFSRSLNSAGVYTLEPAPRPVLVSSFWDIQPQFSPDGTRLVFTSSRSGESLDIWLASADGSNAHQLTHGPGTVQGSPSWSPDGRHIAFDAKGDGGRLAVWTIDADGGSPRRITTGPGDQNTPTWSRDGRWIYFSSNQGARTTRGGCRPTADQPSASRKGGVRTLRSSRWTARTSSTSETSASPRSSRCRSREVPRVSCCRAFGQELRGRPCRDLLRHLWSRPRAVHSPARHDWARSGAREHQRHVPLQLPRMAVAPDGKTILIQQQSLSSDLMLIENFK